MNGTARIAVLAACLALVPAQTLADSTFANTGCDAVCIAAAVHGGVAVDNQGVSAGPNVSKRGVVLFTPGVAAIPANAKATFLPKGIVFPVTTMQSYSAYGTPPGGRIRFELAQDVVAGGYLYAMKGDTAEGTIQAAHEGSFFGGPLGPVQDGSDLRVSVEKIYNFCGDTIAVDFDRSEYRNFRGNWNWLMLIGVGFFLKPDKDVHIIRGQKYAAFSSRPQRVCAMPTNEPDTVPPADALQTTDN